MYMLTRLFHYSVALGLTAIVLFSCKGKDGDPGPQGDAGAAGAAGAKGQPGGTAVLLTKGGFVKGTLTGFRADGVTPLNETFNFEYLHRNENLYTSSVRETEETGVYEFNVQRADSLTRSVFRLNFYAPLDLSTNQLSYIEITYNKDLGNNKLLGVEGFLSQFRGTSQVAELTNLAYNQSTGLLTGNVTWTASNGVLSTATSSYESYSGSSRPFTLTGSFSVQAPRVSSFRKGVKSN